MDKLKVGLVSLGCDKNRIDSEIILGKIKVNSDIVNDPKDAQVIIVNTCGFIEASKQESIDTILDMAKYKTEHKCKLLVVTGCLTQRYGKELMNLMPEIDILLGVNDYDKLNKAIEKCFTGEEEKFYSCNYSDTGVNEGSRILTTDSHTAYLRIGEGCNNFCTYCIIPKIRGKYRSRTIDNILEEANELVNQGVKEIILVAQDTTMYGVDLYEKQMLHELLSKLNKIDKLEWIRVLYCYPEELTKEIIDELSNNSKVCKYLDIPIQHISNSVLKRMGRRGRKEQIVETIKELRTRIPGLVLRTSIIVGFPGETEEEFQELKEFIKDIKFDKLGVFKYSQEEDTPAAIMEQQVDEEVKEKREEELMSIQQEVSKNIHTNKVGRIYDVIIEGKEEDSWFGRNYEMIPEVDGLVYFKDDRKFEIGTMVKVKITHSMEYDLIGVVCDESCQ